jgi:hypothetical protein
MVSINQEPNKTEPRTAADVVCPFCFKLLPYPAVYSETSGLDGLIRRGYQGWCPCCDRSAIVIQYQDGDRWKIEKHKEIKFVPTPDPQWTIVNQPQVKALPAQHLIPIILIGPGGDFNQAVTADQVNATIQQYDSLIAKFGGILNLLNSAKNAITK